MTKLCLDSIKLIAGKKALCNSLSITINSGECWGLLGKNGAGKTSLLKCIAGILKPEEGNISLDAIPIQNHDRKNLALRVGMLFQEGLSSIPSTVFETVLLGRYPHSKYSIKDSFSDIQTTQNILEELKLNELRDRELHTLSGGELQKVGIALLLAQDPDLFLLDEPSNHLDIAFAAQLKTILKERVSKRSASLLLATHDINYVNEFCDRLILMLGDGNLILGKTQEILTEKNLSKAFSCKISKFSNGISTIFHSV